MNALHAAVALALLSAPALAQNGRVEWFQHGWYVGAGVGVAQVDTSAGEVDAALGRLGYATTTKLDETDTAFRFYAGYRFDAPFALELSFDDLGQVSSTIDATPPSLPAFLADVARVHPVSGEGVALRGRYFAFDREPIWVALDAGLWSWEAELDARAITGERATVDRDGIDPLLGLSAGFHVGRRTDLRIDLTRYWIDGEPVDVALAGAQFRLL
jgi:OOP family OmpA-OmpF porin